MEQIEGMIKEEKEDAIRRIEEEGKMSDISERQKIERTKELKERTLEIEDGRRMKERERK